MAKQIKALKCPQCGSTKSSVIKNDHYRCDKCGTEFFLDNDDITVNVNHRYDHQNKPRSGSSNTNKIVIIIVVLFVLFFISPFLIRFCVSRPHPKPTYNTTREAPVQNTKKRSFIQLLQVEGKAVAFYFEGRSNVLKNNDSKGLFIVFSDIVTDKIIKEEKISDNTRCKIDHRYFSSDNSHYFILSDQLIYKISPNEYTFKDITKDIAAAKPALNSGFSTVYFVPEKNGDGFRLTTNLGKEFYYFPNPDMLYAERAFKYIADGKPDLDKESLSAGAKDISYYLFLNKESKQSSNVAQLLEITYKYNNGGPENKLMEATEQSLKQQEKHRIISVKPVTEERISFSPRVLYTNKEHILISYRPTLADNAVTNVQLLSTSGDIVWTLPFSNLLECKQVIKINNGFMLQTEKDSFYEINDKGELKNSYTL